MRVIRYEQAVYGSFPFWDRGYALLARSAGCREEWLRDFQRVCQRYGEPPAGVDPDGALFALRLPSGPWAVVGVSSSGNDDRGRPGALAFHGLFLTGRALRSCPLGPFSLCEALRREWGPETSALPRGFQALPDAVDLEPGACETAAGRITTALRGRRKVAIESATPIEALARDVWWIGGVALRRRSVATLAFSDANRFDLIAVPRLAGLDPNAGYLTLDTLESAAGSRPMRRRWILVSGFLVVALGGVLGALALLKERDPEALPEAVVTPRGVEAISLVTEFPPPLREPAVVVDPDARRLVVDSLIDLADRFGIAEGLAPGADPEPAALIRGISERLRYRGRWLSESEREELRRVDDPEARRVLGWDARLRRFAPDRPLPEDLSGGSTRWQVAMLAWSFHVDPHPGLAPPEMAFALFEALARPESIRPSPLETRYPALADYARFLARLPRS